MSKSPQNAIQPQTAARHEALYAKLSVLARQIEALGVPAVNVSWSTVPGIWSPQVVADEQAIGRLAFEHFQERGFRQFAYVGRSDQLNYVDHCGPAFAQAVADHGGECAGFRPWPSVYDPVKR